MKHPKISGCIQPYTNKEGSSFPCGKCVVCLRRRVNGWSFRLMREYNVSSSAYFVTLTYSTDNVPLSSNGFMTLKKRDVQLFFKRVRKSMKCKNDHRRVKYYICGEYGSKNERPHYHAIIFNADISSIIDAWSTFTNSGQRREIGTWHFGEVTERSIQYTLKYMEKDRSSRYRHARDDRQPEFALMSKGLGSSYLSPQVVDYHKNGKFSFLRKEGFLLSMPRYYRDKIFTPEEREELVSMAALRRAAQEDEYVNYMLKEYGDSWRDKHKDYIAHTFITLKNKKYGRT